MKNIINLEVKERAIISGNNILPLTRVLTYGLISCNIVGNKQYPYTIISTILTTKSEL